VVSGEQTLTPLGVITDRGERLSQTEPKGYRQAVTPGTKAKGDQQYFYPPDGEDPTPMYDGLRTNLPCVSVACFIIQPDQPR